ncbi:Uncharacterised protein [Mycobacterium tuberculosis]|nr:Uncharacterised protein [Mycobacterium tuberculosis]
MCGAGDHGELAFPGYYRLRSLVQLEDHLVASTHDQQRRCHHAPQRITREIGPAAAGHHRPHVHARIGGRDQRRTRSRAGAEVADRQRCGVGLGGQPTGHVDESGSEQLNVEDVGAVAFFFGREQVE